MDAIVLVRMALSVLSERLIMLVALALVFSLACWTMWDPRWERMLTMAFFSIFSFLIITRSTPNAKPQTSETA